MIIIANDPEKSDITISEISIPRIKKIQIIEPFLRVSQFFESNHWLTYLNNYILRPQYLVYNIDTCLKKIIINLQYCVFNVG